MARRSVRLTLLLLVVLGCGSLAAAGAAPPSGLPLWAPGDPDPTYPFSDRYPAAIVVATESEARDVVATGVDVESVLPIKNGWLVRANVNDTERSALLQKPGREIYRLRNLARESFLANPPGSSLLAWPTFDQFQADLQAVAAAHPSICRLVSIGRSVQNRDIWFMKISDNPDVEEDEPEFKYSSSIHGNEVTGMEMCRRLIHLLVDSYGIDPTLTGYVNDAEIWICPMSNPDGFVAATRYNGHGVDLNRDFPDPVTDPIDSPAGREPETQAFMNFGYAHRFILSANYHGGSLVMNYPWDCQAAYTPDDTMLRNFSLGYSFRNPPMWNSPEFEHGVTIGWAWYIIHGGLQDWSYNWRSDMDITIECSNVFWPDYSTMDQFWLENRDAMLWYMSRVFIGIQGIVTDATTGLPIDATVDVTEIGKTLRTDPDVGDFHRMLEPGTYTLEVQAFGYQSQMIPGIVVDDGPATRRDVALQRLPTYEVSGTVTDEGTGTPLSATVTARRSDTGELVGQTATDPGTGSYSLSLLSFTYDVGVAAAGHVTETRRVNLDQARTEDFSLAPMASVILVVRDGYSTRIPGDLTQLGLRNSADDVAATDPATWSQYKLLIWSAGSSANPISDAAKRQAIETYVAGGGRLLIEGGQIGYDALRSPGYPTFAQNVIHCTAWDVSNAGMISIASGQSGHAIVTTPNDLPNQYAIQYSGASDQDAVRPRTEATLIYKTQNYPNDAGILVYDDTPVTPERGQVVYYAFNYDKFTDVANARNLLQNTVAYLNRTNPADVAESLAISAFLLGAPYPNPASGMIHFRLPGGAGRVLAEIYDLQGRRIWSQSRMATTEEVLSWDGRRVGGVEAPTGVYFLRLHTDGREASRPFLWIRQ